MMSASYNSGGGTQTDNIIAGGSYNTQYNAGMANYHLPPGQFDCHRSYCYVWSVLTLPVKEREEPKPEPFSTVPFKRDPDFVHRDALEEIGKKLQPQTSWAALVGLGGVA